MSGTLKAGDAIYGAMARGYSIINGSREEMFWAKQLEAKIEKNKTEIAVLGQTGKKHKAGGWTGTGSMTIYYCTPIFRQMMLEYIKTGKDTYFDTVIENEDPTSDIGVQSVMLKGVNIDGVVMAMFDVDTEAMEEDIDFTFNDVEILKAFTPAVPE